MILSIIVAMDEQRAIGKNQELLCYLPEDLKYFKRTTLGKPIIMGRKTFESLPNGALPKRRNIVLTRQSGVEYANCDVCNTLEEAKEILVEAQTEEAFVIGGGEIYSLALPMADRLYLTRLHASFDDADTHFPEINWSEWTLASSEAHEADERHACAYTFEVYHKSK